MRLALALLLLAIGCGDSLVPADLAGGYRLATVNGTVLPSPVGASGECDEHVVAGSLALRAGGGFTLTYTSATGCGGQVSMRAHGISGMFHLDGRRLALSRSETMGPRTPLEGELRGTGFILLVPGSEVPALELGFEPGPGPQT